MGVMRTLVIGGTGLISTGITRQLLDSIGTFDEVNFPRGYGEENDYSFRVADAGLDLLVATHTYVFHSKSRSYGTKDRQALAQAGAAPLDARLLSVDSVLIDKPGVSLSNALSYYSCQGHAVRVPHAPSNGLVRIYNTERQFLGVGEVLGDGRIAPRRLLMKV
jgi:hypothetical protein